MNGGEKTSPSGDFYVAIDVDRLSVDCAGRGVLRYVEIELHPLTPTEWILAGGGAILALGTFVSEVIERDKKAKADFQEQESHLKEMSELHKELARARGYNEASFGRFDQKLDRIESATSDPEVKAIVAELKAELTTRPLITYDHFAEETNKHNHNAYTHLWFRNQPTGRTARDVVPRINWTSKKGQPLFAFEAKWQETPWNLGPLIRAANRLDFAPDDKLHALDLCIRKPDTAEFYVLDIDTPNRNPFAQDRRLQPGIYEVYVQLSCDGYSGNFRFTVRTDENKPLQVEMVASR